MHGDMFGDAAARGIGGGLAKKNGGVGVGKGLVILVCLTRECLSITRLFKTFCENI
jgi:hypothetical protein